VTRLFCIPGDYIIYEVGMVKGSICSFIKNRI
jgi:hypothetical protein